MLRTIRRILHINRAAIAMALCLMLVSGCMKKSTYHEKTTYPVFEPTEKYETNITEVEETEAFYTEEADAFYKEDIPKEIRNKMWNVTISESSVMSFSDLSYLTVTYMGYDDEKHEGHLIVDKNLADEVLSIFKELYEIGFPIEKMNLPDEYGGSDELSMEDNNTSAFNDRPVAGTNTLSNHALGRAIDINPLINPYVKYSTDTVLPKSGREHLDRTLNEKGSITKDSECVEIFEKYGWTWGGNWKTLKDYQHFEKKS